MSIREVRKSSKFTEHVHLVLTKEQLRFIDGIKEYFGLSSRNETIRLIIDTFRLMMEFGVFAVLRPLPEIYRNLRELKLTRFKSQTNNIV